MLKNEKHPLWKGDKVSYKGLHLWLKRNFGKANKCEHCYNPVAKRYEWALIKGKKYQHKRENFIQLCTKCHHNYDESPVRDGVKPWNFNSKIWTKEIRRKYMHNYYITKLKIKRQSNL